MILVAGLGMSGQSALKFLQNNAQECIAFDTRAGFDTAQLEIDYPTIKFYKLVLPNNIINKITKIILSPGISLKSPWLSAFNNIPIIGDIEVFAQNTNKPIIAITGSNGKSTVTSLVNEVLLEAGFKVGMGGNIGIPALDLLMAKQHYDIYVLEISSFQLETTFSLQAMAATILNLSEDHMDRYPNLRVYTQAKMRIFNNAKLIILPKDDNSFYDVNEFKNKKNVDFFAIDDRDYLYIGKQKIMAIKEMALQGEHHLLNAAATICLTKPLNIKLEHYRNVFKRFTGLAHRSQTIAIKNGIEWINDSKATNVGATLTAINSLTSCGKKNIILIAGGDGKGADFSPLKATVADCCKEVILFGRDSELIKTAITSPASQLVITQVDDLAEAVKLAHTKYITQDITPQTTVLFSPACASFDQFKSYIDRGNSFIRLVKDSV